MLSAVVELPHGERAALRLVELHQIAEARVAQRAPPGRRGIRAVRAGHRVGVVACEKSLAQRVGEVAAQRHAHSVDRIRVRPRSICSARNASDGSARPRPRTPGRVARRRARARKRRRTPPATPSGLPSARRLDPAQHDVGGEPLARLPAIEGIAVVRHQVRELGVAVVVLRTTGAEKPRSSEGTGCAGTFYEVRSAARPAVSDSTRSLPARAASPSSCSGRSRAVRARPARPRAECGTAASPLCPASAACDCLSVSV